MSNMIGPCACGRFQSFPETLPPLADGTYHLPACDEPVALCEVSSLRAGLASARSEVARLTTERDEARKWGQFEAGEAADAKQVIWALREELDIAAHRLAESEDAASAAEATAEQLRGALAACVAELETAIRRLAEEGLVPQAINYRNRERWAALAASPGDPTPGTPGKERA